MIHFDPVPKPPNFEEAAVMGQQWLQAHPGAARPRDYWSPFRSALAEGFRNLCAYGAMYEPSGQVDHFVSWDEDPSLAFRWENYRYASGWLNASKKNLRSSDLLDPFIVQDGWFEISLPSLQLLVSASIPPTIRAKAENLLTRLHLRDDERVIRQRRVWLDLYEKGDLSLSGLRVMAPLVADAVEKQAKNCVSNKSDAVR